MAINFFSSKDSEEICTMHSKIIEDFLDSFLQKYQKGLEESMTGSEFVFDNFDSLYYKLHKTSLNRGGS